MTTIWPVRGNAAGFYVVGYIQHPKREIVTSLYVKKNFQDQIKLIQKYNVGDINSHSTIWVYEQDVMSELSRRW